jgi:hypothetical protein
LDVVVSQEKPVVSYLTPLTGLTEEIVKERGARPSAAAAAAAAAASSC